MRYLSVAEVIDIWANIFGKERLAGIRDYKLLESAVNKPKATFGGKDLYEGVLMKAVVLCEAIIKNHPFTDGNKRVGVLALLEFLEVNGYDTSKIPDDVLYNIAVGFASGKLKRKEAIRMLKPFLQIESYIAYVNAILEKTLSVYVRKMSENKAVVLR